MPFPMRVSQTDPFTASVLGSHCKAELSKSHYGENNLCPRKSIPHIYTNFATPKGTYVKRYSDIQHY